LTARKSLKDEIFDVVIVGCGPVGAVAANLFGRAGLRTLVLEKAQEVYTLPRAIHLDHEVMRALQRAGVADLVAPTLTIPAGTMHIGADGGVIRQLRTPLRNDRFGWASDYFFYQPEFETKLREGFARWSTLTARFGCEVVGVDQNEEVRICARDADGRECHFRARYLIACDGASSIVRKNLEIALDDLGFDERWVVVDALVDGAISFPTFSGVPEGADLQNTLVLVADPRRPVSAWCCRTKTTLPYWSQQHSIICSSPGRRMRVAKSFAPLSTASTPLSHNAGHGDASFWPVIPPTRLHPFTVKGFAMEFATSPIYRGSSKL
jgi:2-polyprenyl-6-methoxyphenol hydroxylase-like FAD-dependent oxidoreductase